MQTQGTPEQWPGDERQPEGKLSVQWWTLEYGV